MLLIIIVVVVVVLGYGFIGNMAEMMGTAAGSNPKLNNGNDLGCVTIATVFMLVSCLILALMGTYEIIPYVIGFAVVMWVLALLVK